MAGNFYSVIQAQEGPSGASGGLEAVVPQPAMQTATEPPPEVPEPANMEELQVVTEQANFYSILGLRGAQAASQVEKSRSAILDSEKKKTGVDIQAHTANFYSILGVVGDKPNSAPSSLEFSPFDRGDFDVARSPEFDAEAESVANRLGINPSYLMAVMSFESAGTFDADIRNAAGSGAVGLIQFMPKTARGLGTTPSQLAAMSPVQQLEFVEKYFQPYKGKLKSLEDVYMAVLWPRAIGKPNDYVLFRKDNARSKAYAQNRGLDFNKDGLITKGEAAAKVRKHLPGS